MIRELGHIKKSSAKGNIVNHELTQEAISLGCLNAKVILTKTISLGSWNKLQCQYGCPFYAKRLTCPPYSPVVDEMAHILSDYDHALIIETPSAKQSREIGLALEANFKCKGFHKAFALSALPCDLCEVCSFETGCKYPTKARPTLYACGIDVKQTVFNNGWNVASNMQPCTETLPIGMVLIN